MPSPGAPAAKPGRGAKPAPAAAGGSEEPTLEDVRAEMADPDTTPARKSELAILAREMRGHKQLFADKNAKN